MLVRWARVDDAPHDLDVLGSAARLRATRLPRDEHRRVVGARLLLRQVVVDALGVDGDALELRQRCERCGGAHGRPVLVIAGERGPYVSIAHALDVAMVAVGRRPVGVDLEPAGVVPDVERWVRTEAALKATGHGLDVDPTEIDVTGAGEPPRVVAWRGPGPRPTLRLRDLAVDGFAAAVATVGLLPARIDAAPMALSRR